LSASAELLVQYIAATLPTPKNTAAAAAATTTTTKACADS